MTKLQIIVIIVLIILAAEILLKLFGVLSLSSNEIFGYVFFIYGISSVFISLGKNQKGVLFIGSLIFSIGFILLIISNFEILDTNSIVFPSTMFVIATGFLILFFDESANKVFLILASIFYLITIASVIYNGTLEPGKFLGSLESVILKFWPVEAVVIAGILLYGLFRKE